MYLNTAQLCPSESKGNENQRTASASRTYQTNGNSFQKEGTMGHNNNKTVNFSQGYQKTGCAIQKLEHMEVNF